MDRGGSCIQYTTPDSSGTLETEEGVFFTKGSSVRLMFLDGLKDLRGVTLSALNEAGEVVWNVSFPENEDGTDPWTHYREDGWCITKIH